VQTCEHGVNGAVDPFDFHGGVEGFAKALSKHTPAGTVRLTVPDRDRDERSFGLLIRRRIRRRRTRQRRRTSIQAAFQLNDSIRLLSDHPPLPHQL
jgi:hypothetical protein